MVSPEQIERRARTDAIQECAEWLRRRDLVGLARRLEEEKLGSRDAVPPVRKR